MLPPRRDAILKSIVGQYITSAVPVPSMSVCGDSQLGVSPATIRNEMMLLEEEGYIIRPYSSSGSMPSDKGYRYYVGSLDNIELPLPEQRLVSHLFYQVEKELKEWLSLAAALIAQLAQNMAMVTTPRPMDCQFRHLELVALRGTMALAVVIFCGGRVREQLVIFDQDMAQPELTAIANKLNTVYSGLTGSQIKARDMELSPVEKQLTDLITHVMQDKQEYEGPYLDGLRFMVSQPELADKSRMAALMELVEHRKLVETVVPKKLVRQGVRVTIGKENEAEAIQNYSVVTSWYGLPGEVVGAIGVIGPTRMPYARTISIIEYLSSVLSRLMAELYERETPTG